ncbi:MAG: polysaccharide pyruvyl transferase family protein [Thomasclavelia spiroformis]|uniref:polysaccharide pyruvyl transferase family protein n=1 Tax=Thomasclavelia spiroformis TaxID=29348 RepID=UPI003990C64F
MMNIKGKIYNKMPLNLKIKLDIKSKVKNIDQKEIIFCNKNPRVFIIGESDNGNIGDLAITRAHYQMIKKNVNENTQIIRILYSNFWEYFNFLKKNIRSCDLITIPGGGNIGDVYIEAESIRQIIINEFKNNEIIIFPSTIFFSDKSSTNELYKRSLKIYNSHRNLTIYAREKYSFDILRSLYSNAKIHLVPDIVFKYKFNNKEIKRENKVLLCLRNDTEKKITSEETQALLKTCDQKFLKTIHTDTFIENVYAVEDSYRDLIINKKLKEFSTAKLIITDRLHGMVLSYITKTPCIVFANYNYKIKGVYKWIEKDENIFFADDVEKAIEKINNFCEKNEYIFNVNLQFDYKILEKQIINWKLKHEAQKNI